MPLQLFTIIKKLYNYYFCTFIFFFARVSRFFFFEFILDIPTAVSHLPQGNNDICVFLYFFLIKHFKRFFFSNSLGDVRSTVPDDQKGV